MLDPSNEARLGELLEKRLRGGLSEDERRELEALFEREPGARALADQLDREEQTMNRTIASAVDLFDFEKARRAVTVKLAADRAWLKLQTLFGIMVVVVAAVVAWPKANWGLIVFVAAAMMFGVLGRAWAVARQRTIAGSIDGPVPLEAVFQRHLRGGRNEFTVLRALIIMGGLGLVILLVDSLVNASYFRAALAAIMLIVFGPLVARRLFSRTAVARHEKYLAGDLSYSAWISGKDEPR